MINILGIRIGNTVKDKGGNVFKVNDIYIDEWQIYDFDRDIYIDKTSPFVSLKGESEIEVSYCSLKRDYALYREPTVKLPNMKSFWSNTNYDKVGCVVNTYCNDDGTGRIKIEYAEGNVRSYTNAYFVKNFTEL